MTEKWFLFFVCADVCRTVSGQHGSEMLREFLSAALILVGLTGNGPKLDSHKQKKKREMSIFSPLFSYAMPNY